MAEKSRSADLLWSSAAQRGMRAVVAGRFTEAEEHLQTIIRISREFKTSFAASFIQMLRTSIRRETGTLDESDLGPAPPTTRFYARARRLDVQARIGDVDEARREVQELAHALDQFRRDQDFVASLSLLAEVCARLGDSHSARILYPQLRPYAAYYAVTSFSASVVCHGAVPRYLGLLATTLGQWDDAANHSEVALEMHSRIGARVLVAHCKYEYATLLLTRRRPHGRPVSVRPLLEEALEAFEELGMPRYSAEVRAVLTAGRAIPAPRRHYPAGLSEREVEVLCLIAAGKSNPEIAAELVLSRNTVQRHVSNILAKAGLVNRAEAAAYAQRNDLCN